MSPFALLLLCVSCALSRAAVSDDCECGQVRAKARIINGNETVAHNYPWMVAIVEPGTNKFLCGGTLINSKYVLTAAHCLKGQLAVAVGAHDFKQKDWAEVIKVANAIPREDYGGVLKPNNDLGLLKLSKAVTFSAKVRPACLPPPELREFENIVATGWGTLAYVGKNPDRLQEVALEHIPFEECSEIWSHVKMVGAKGRITKDHICVMSRTEKKGPCQGDSGGPLTAMYKGFMYVVGVTSFGHPNCRTTVPTAYVRLNGLDYLDWIAKNTKDGEYCQNPQL